MVHFRRLVFREVLANIHLGNHITTPVAKTCFSVFVNLPQYQSDYFVMDVAECNLSDGETITISAHPNMTDR